MQSGLKYVMIEFFSPSFDNVRQNFDVRHLGVSRAPVPCGLNNTSTSIPAMAEFPDITPETAEEIFRKPLTIRSAADRTGEFFHFEPGAEPGHWRKGHTVRQQAELLAKRQQRHMTPAMLEKDPRAPNHWPSSHKVRNIESVHLPEMAGWHRRSQGLPGARVCTYIERVA